MKHVKKALALFLTAALLTLSCLPALAAAAPTRWSITGPYDAVDWDTWGSGSSASRTASPSGSS